ncbi:methyltransferase domain-containing protein [Brasilonema sp. UFV-L1]|uniref:SAM-dependent methyltransferase n=1 Tax=Brasilonema sp. UFV-L1 TaxID=2234130 RepID=UPI00145DFA31|nr:methyltransferase domain-containing protein [Brasilonema sp. UFV-L1]NMG08653.1 hypothetical protein [Brasilonema sp. UFV-L1]
MTQLSSSIQNQSLAVATWYDRVWPFARLLWLNEDNLAVHLGYWDENTRSHAESLINMNQAMAERVGMFQGARVLDAGCGFGGTSLWLAKEYGARVVGVNISSDQVARANHYAKKRGLDDFVSFENVNLLNTGLPDGSFDIFWAQESLLHILDKQLFLAEAYRLLKPGGKLVVQDSYLFNRTYSQKEERHLQAISSGGLIPRLPRPDEFITWARTVGFQDICIEDISHYAKRSCIRSYRQNMFFYPIGQVLRTLRIQSEQEYRSALGNFALYRTFQLGLWFLAICTARKSELAQG